MDMYMLLYLKWITNKDLLYSTLNSARCYVGAWIWGRMNTCKYMAESVVCLPETITTLLISYAAAAAAAKSLQSCPTLCDPMDCSLPGSSIHGIFQGRVLEWGAIATHTDNSMSKQSRRRQWHPTPVLLPGKSHGRRSLVGCSPWGR